MHRGKSTLDQEAVWRFVLYRARCTRAGNDAESALRRLCEFHVPERYLIDIVDIKGFSAVIPPGVITVPTVIRTMPLPERRVTGGLSNVVKASEGLGLTGNEGPAQ